MDKIDEIIDIIDEEIDAAQKIMGMEISPKILINALQSIRIKTNEIKHGSNN